MTDHKRAIDRSKKGGGTVILATGQVTLWECRTPHTANPNFSKWAVCFRRGRSKERGTLASGFRRGLPISLVCVPRRHEPKSITCLTDRISHRGGRGANRPGSQGGGGGGGLGEPGGWDARCGEGEWVGKKTLYARTFWFAPRLSQHYRRCQHIGAVGGAKNADLIHAGHRALRR